MAPYRKLLCASPFALALACVAAPAAATTLYETDFEAPTFQAGSLNGQGGWVQSPQIMVQSSLSIDGAQSLFMTATTGQQIVGHRISYSAVGNPASLVDISIDAVVFGTSTTVAWNPISVFGSAGFIASVNIYQDTAYSAAPFANPPAVSLYVKHHFEMQLDFKTDMQTSYMDGLLIGSVAFYAPATDLTFVALGQNGGAPGPSLDAIYLDNLSVVAVPEPSSWAMWLGGLAALSGLAARRRGSV